MGAQVLVYSYLRDYYPYPYKSEWPVLFLSSLENALFNWEIKQMFHRFTQTVKAFFNYIISDIVIAWAFITLQRIESIFQFIHLNSFGFHNKIGFAYKVFKWGRSIWNFTCQAFPYICKERINSCAMFDSPNKST